MKSIFLLLALASPLLAAPPALTPEVMAEIKRNSPLSKMEQPQAGEAKVLRPESQSLIKDSMILHDGTYWTLVPKGAVIHIPKIMEERVSAKPVGKLITWEEFLTQNRGWISTCEVSFEQASGKTPLDPKKVEFWKKQDKIMVAVHSGGPISVKPGSESAPTQAISQR